MRVASLLFTIAAACQGGGGHFSDAAVPDDPVPIDAIAALDAAPPAPGRELTSGGGRVHGTRHVLEVQIGHGVAQRPTRGEAAIVEGNAAVKP